MDAALRHLLATLHLGHDVEAKACALLASTRLPDAQGLEGMARMAAAVAVASVLCGGTHTEAEVAFAAQVPESAVHEQLDRLAATVDIELLL